MRALRPEYVLAFIALLGSLGNGAVAAAIAFADDAPSAEPEACVAVLDRVADLIDEHPDVAWLYSSSSGGLPRLASEAEVARCGSLLPVVRRVLRAQGKTP